MGIDGFLVLDKPPGMTSRAALDRAARWFPKRTRIGHGGTLDPLATGVLVLALGKATRLIEYVQQLPKVYETTIVLGASSDTDDADGVITPTIGANPPGLNQIQEAVPKFIGEFDQVPPVYSAARIDGERSYDRARSGRPVVLAPRRVRVDRIEVRGYAWPNLRLTITCGKGTYVRSLARDLGQALRVGGYVATLRRTRIGPFRVDDAIGLDADADSAHRRLLPMTAPLEGMPHIVIAADDVRRVQHGQSLLASRASSLLRRPEASGRPWATTTPAIRSEVADDPTSNSGGSAVPRIPDHHRPSGASDRSDFGSPAAADAPPGPPCEEFHDGITTVDNADQLAALVDAQGGLVAVARLVEGRWHPVKVVT